MKVCRLIILIVPLGAIMIAGTAAGVLSDALGWVSDRLRDAFEEMYGAL